MPTTPNYAIPYQTLTDPPDGAGLGEDGFLATDAALAGLDLRIDALETLIQNLLAPGWTAYTPVWSTSGSAPSIGNGTLTGRYRRPTGSDVVIAEIRLVWGSTTSSGTGVFFFTLPFTATSDAATLSGGSWFGNDVAAQDYSGAVKLETTTTFRLVSSTGSAGSTAPFTWANTDNLRAQIIYQPA